MAASLAWSHTATLPLLAESELHVWRASLDLPRAILNRLANTLNAQEKDRAERFLVPHARDRFVAARGILRELLGDYLGLDAAKVTLSYRPQGKPFVSPEHNSRICFNVSHSHGMGLFAFGSGQEVGVDIERVKYNFKGIEIASHFFSEEETAGLAKLPQKQAEEAFFALWTKKEAYVKARGQGLSIPLRSFTVRFAAKEQFVRDEVGAMWSCYAVEPATGFSGAVVAASEGWRLNCWEWTPGVEIAASDVRDTKTPYLA
jgi:4'-phosphopantetheinyl transferase